MYIEFLLPDRLPSRAACVAAVVDYLELWSARYKVAYKTKTVKNTFRVTFDHNSYYTLFATTWVLPDAAQLGSQRVDYHIVEPMKL